MVWIKTKVVSRYEWTYHISNYILLKNKHYISNIMKMKICDTLSIQIMFSYFQFLLEAVENYFTLYIS